MNDEQVLHAIAIDDAYCVERVFARGAGGITELVTIEGAGPFVRKKIPVELANQTVWSAIGVLDCARLPKVEATYSLPDYYVVVYDYVPGPTLEERVVGKGKLALKEAVSLALDVCEAAAALHSCGVIHRDLSPRNVIVSADGAHLIDLGIARMRVEGATRDTAFLGTRGFASPEQYGFAQTDARSDVYAIGKLLGYMLTGVQPDEDAYETLLTNSSEVDARCAACVQRACAFEPSARYQSAEEMAFALREAAGMAPVEATPVPQHAGADAGTSEGATADVDTAAGRGTDGKTASDVGANSGAAASSDANAGVNASAPASAPSANRALSVRAVVLLVAVAVLAVSVVAFFLFGQADGGKQNASATSAATSSGETSAKTSTSESGNAATGSTDDADGATAAANVTSTPVSDEFPLELVESGWSADSNGYIHFACNINNTSEDLAVEVPLLRIVGYDKDGSVLFSEETGPMVCAPGQTSYFAGQTMYGGETPERVEFALIKGSGTETHRVTDSVSFSASDVTVRTTDYGGLALSGTVSIQGSDAALKRLSSLCSMTAIYIVLRDADGNIVAGYNEYLYSLSVGENQSYSMELYDVPDYATIEAYVQPW